MSEAEESEPIESMKLRKAEEHQQQQESSNNEGTGTGTVNTVLKSNSNRLSKELRCELAVTAVKRAFSQCPNLSLLVSLSLYSLSFHNLSEGPVFFNVFSNDLTFITVLFL